MEIVLTASERLARYRSHHRIEVDKSSGWDRCDTDGVRVYQVVTRRWQHDPDELIRLQRQAAEEQEAARVASVIEAASAPFRELERESRYFREHEDDDISLQCLEEGHAPACPGRAGGEHRIVVGGNGGYVVVAEIA